MNKRMQLQKRCFALLLLSAIVVIIFVNINRNDTVCFYNQEWNDGKTLPNVAENLKLRSHDEPKNIFFHETSCSHTGIVNLNPRQACAIESAANMNENHEVFVLFTSQVGFRNSTSLPIIDALLSYPNVHFNYLNLTQYAEHTPLADWIKNGELFHSEYVNSHTSDVLRFLSLWKYSGTYLDLDIVMLKSLDVLKPNYACAESYEDVAVGIINLENEHGHEIADLCVKDLRKNFDGHDWGYNGPGVMTRVLHKICNTKDVKKMISSNICRNFHVLPVESCYSIRWKEWKKFFEEKYLNEAMAQLNTSIIAHVWNKHSVDTPLTTDMKVAYIELAKKHCPKVVAASQLF